MHAAFASRVQLRGRPAIIPSRCFTHAQVSLPELTCLRRGGSFYVQSKIWSAKEALIDDVRRTQAQSEKEQPTADRATKDSTVGDRFSDADAEHYRDLRQQQPSRVFYSESNATSAYVFDGSTAHGIFRGRRLSWPAADRTSVVLQ